MRGITRRAGPLAGALLLLAGACASLPEEEPLLGRYTFATEIHIYSPCGSFDQYRITPGLFGDELRIRHGELGLAANEWARLEGRGRITLIPPEPMNLRIGPEPQRRFRGTVELSALDSLGLLPDGECD